MCDSVQEAAADDELKARTTNMGTFLVWPETQAGRQRKPNSDAIKLNRAPWYIICQLC